MPTEMQNFVLPENVAGGTENPVLCFLRGAKRKPVSLSVKEVRHVGPRGLQMLLSAQIQWRADDIRFVLTDMTDAFSAALIRVGLDPDFFETEPSE